VKKTKAVTWTGDYKTASKSADFGLSAVADADGDPLQFGVKVLLNKSDRSGKTYSNVSGATVTAGDSLAVACTDNTDGYYYCAVPLTQTGIVANADSIPVGGQSENYTCSYTDRTVGSNAQSTCTINAREPNPLGGGGGGGGGNYTPTPVPTPTPYLSVTPTPTSTPNIYSTPTSTPVASIGTKLYRKASDPKVYVLGPDGSLTWVKTLAEFNAAGYKWTDVKMISGTEFAKMRVGGSVRVVKGIGYLRIRSSPSTTGSIVGKALANQEFKFTEIKNGWYHISSGWISGSYAKEF